MLDYAVKLKQLSNFYTKDWLLGFVHCLYINKLINGERTIYFNNYVENLKRK